MIDVLGMGLVGIAAFVAVISLIVVIHELGHYFAGRMFGVHAEAFSLGFGPTLFARKDRSGTIWRVAAIPLGGYVRFLGDAGAASEPDREKLAQMRRDMGPDAGRCFHFKPIWQRAIIVLAGPMANFVLALAIFTGMAATLEERVYAPVVGEVTEARPADLAGMRPGDLILSIDGRRIDSFGQISTGVILRPGEAILFEVERDGEILVLNVRPELTRDADGLGGRRPMARIGIGAADEFTMIRHNPVEAVGIGATRVWSIVALTGDYLGRVVTGRMTIELLNGPIGLLTTSGQVANISLSASDDGSSPLVRMTISLLLLAATFSVGLGLVNLLPLPILDGGHLVYYAYEAIARRPLSARAQEMGFRVGLALVVGMMLVASWNDLHYLRDLLS